MAYSPNDTHRPAFVKACADRKRLTADIIRSVKNDKDYKILYEHIFPDRAAPNVKLPSGYRDILEGALLDGSIISDTQLENVRSNLMEELRKESSPLSLNLGGETRSKLQKVVMVTAPKWISEFKPTAKLFKDEVEKFVSNAEEVAAKTQLPENDIEILRGPLGFMLILFGVMIVALVVRLMLSAATSGSDDFILKQAFSPPSYGGQTAINGVKIFPSGSTSNTLGGMVHGLINKNVDSPNITMSYAIIPGYILYEILQIGFLLIYIALMPLVLIVSNTSHLFGMRSLQMIESLESVFFSTNKGYSKILKFTTKDSIKMKSLFDFESIQPQSLDEIIVKLKEISKSSQTPTKIRLLLSENKAEDFVSMNLKRFMIENDDGKFKLTEDALINAMDSYNLFRFDGESLGKYFTMVPDFLNDIAKNSFAQPVLIKVSEREYELGSQYFWQPDSQQYLKLPDNFSNAKVPTFKFSTKTNPLTNKSSVEKIVVEFKPGSDIELVDKIPKQSGSSSSIEQTGGALGDDPVALDSANRNSVSSEPRSILSEAVRTPEEPQVDESVQSKPTYLLVNNKDAVNEKQKMFNLSASFTRNIGVFAGSVSSLSAVLLLIVLITNTLESMFGNFQHYDNSVFQKMVFVTSDAYYNWVADSKVSKTDVDNLRTYITKTNAKIKIVDISKATNDETRINTLIKTYNEDVASQSFLRNQMFFRTIYTLFMVTLPFFIAWMIGLVDTRLTFNILGTMGLEGVNDMYDAANAILPPLTTLIFIITFITAVVYMRKEWIQKDTKDLKEDKKPFYWNTTDNLNRSDEKNSPMKENFTKKSSNEKSRARRTLRFMTTTGTTSGSGLNQNEQQKRLLMNDNIYNLKGFERSRVLFITSKDDLHGYYLKFINPIISKSTSASSSGGVSQMETSKKSGTMSSLFTGTITSIIVVALVLTLYGIIQLSLGGIMPSSGPNNVLNNSSVAFNLLKSHFGSYNDESGQIIVAIGQAIVFITSVVMLFVNLFATDSEITAASGSDMEATELAYGTLAYIDPDARPATQPDE